MLAKQLPTLIITPLLPIKLYLHDLYLIWGVINECIYTL